MSVRTINPALRYYRLSERVGRVLKSIGVMYFILNGSTLCLVFGVPWLLRRIWASADVFWASTMSGLIVIAVALIGAMLIRRFRLSISQMNFWLNSLTALAAAGLIVIVLMVYERLFTDGFSNWQWFMIFQWTWQIPVGLWIARGLNWSIVDRRTSGVVTVDDRNVEGHDHDHHHDELR